MIYVNFLGVLKTQEVKTDDGEVVQRSVYWEEAVIWLITIDVLSDLYRNYRDDSLLGGELDDD